MAYNSLIDRSNDAAALIPEEASREIIQNATEGSAVLQLARRLPNMSRGQQRLPVLNALAQAYFVSGDTGLKQTTEMAWKNVYVYAEELAVIVPIPECVLDDVDYDIWAEVRPSIEEAFGKALDAAILFGTDAPDAWPTDILAAATAASHTVTAGTGADLYEDILGEGGTIAKIEADGFMANGHIAAMSMRGKLRGVRDENGGLIFSRSMQEAQTYMLDGERIVFPRNGGFNAASALMFSGDWNQLVYSIRQDMTYKILTEAVIQDGAGNILYNLAQQDMVALRAVMRLGWALPNPINRMQATEASRYPFAVLVP